MASVAPVLCSVLIWILTKSSFALVFALLGPIVAIASLADAKIQGRRRARRQLGQFRRELAATRTLIDERHAGERAELKRTTPGAGDILAASIRDPERWRADPRDGLPVSLGFGSVTSALRLEGAAVASRASKDEVDAELAQLCEYAGILAGAPVIVDARLGIGVCGPAALSAAVARGVLLQLAHSLSPAIATLCVPDDPGLGWLRQLPHANTSVAPDRSTGSYVRWQAVGESAIVAVADDQELLPGECRVVLRVGGGRSAELLRNPGSDSSLSIDVEFVSNEQAVAGAELLAAAAEARGIVVETEAVPAVGDFSTLPVTLAAADHGSLECTFAWASGGTFAVDLVADGPHAVVGGTTGSGKSELLVSWVLAMAAAHSPRAVNFLLVDFKGGSSFTSVQGLLHVVGVVTDLDDRSAHRALLSLRAELRYRERTLADAGARAIDEPGVALPRLVIVVDEFAAMVADFPELHELFADLAARGRSLGIHLILCTQRPAGVVRDAVMANSALRLSLRVNNRADSVAVIGTPDAAQLQGDAPGRAFVSIAGGPPQLVQVARATTSDVARVAAIWQSADTDIRRPWCDDLPRVVPLGGLTVAGRGIPFGLLDLPEQQRQQIAVYDPVLHGNLLVIGGQGCGKSELLATLHEAPGVERVPPSIEEAWDVLAAAVRRVRRATAGPRLLVIDDLDALLGRFSDDFQTAFVDILVELLREGGSAGVRLALAVRRVPAVLQTIAGLCDSRLILRMPTRQDHLMSGGVIGYAPDAPPGAGEWQGVRLQVAIRELRPETPELPESPELPGSPLALIDFSARRALAVVSTRPRDFARRLRESGCPLGEVIELADQTPSHSAEVSVIDTQCPSVIVADPETWQSHWGLVGSVRSSVSILFDRCSLAEFRAVSGRRTLPPPLSPLSGNCWLLEPDGAVSRVRALPGG